MRSWSLVVAVAVVLAACGGASDSASPSGLPTSDPTASSAPATTAAASAFPTTAPTPTPTAPPAHSVALGVDGDVPGFLAGRGTGVVALGADHVWVSEDGLAWEASEISGIDGYVVRLVEGGDGTLVAFGYAGDGQAHDSFRTWTSPDGRNWQAADVGLPPAFIFLEIGRGERGYVLVGRALLDDASPEQLWFSPDAVTWQLVYSTSDDEFLAAVGAGPEGFVAVGQQGFRTGSPRAFVLASGDGRLWIRPSEGGVLAETDSLWSVVPLHGDWVASPLTVGTELALLWSRNGLDWEELASLPLERTDSGVIGSLMSNGSRLFVAVGVGSEQSATSVLLTSLDGSAWSPTDIPLTEGFAGGFASAAGVDLFLVDGSVHVHRR